MIVSKELYVTYKWRQDPVLKGVSGTFAGKHIILGPNGSGKTTFFKALCGLTNVKSGEILVDGKNIEEIYSTRGILSTNFREVYSLLAINAYDVIQLYTDLSDGDPSFAYQMITDLGLELELLKKQKINELSAGQIKIVCTALAFAMNAEHVLLDEPFEQLDPAKKGRLISYLNKHKGVILLNTHETWLLKSLRDWSVFFMFEGILYGPLAVEDLLNVKIVTEDVDDALLKVKIAGYTISFLKGEGEGTLLTSIENVDKIYEFAEAMP